MDNNTAYHAACLDHIINVYKSKKNYRNVEILSDGCSAQYKNKSNAAYITTLPDKHDLDHVVHTFAPTANFKCCVDSAGADTKATYKRYELNGKGDHCYTAYMVYKMLLANMREPQPRTPKSEHMHIDEREQIFVCSQAQYDAIPVSERDDSIIVYDDTTFYEVYDALKPLNTIKSRFQLRVSKQVGGNNVIEFRSVHCHCDPCLSYNSTTCVYCGEAALRWCTMNLKKT